MARKYFGTDGIRGRANGVITPELALKVGQALRPFLPQRLRDKVPPRQPQPQPRSAPMRASAAIGVGHWH